MNSLIIEDDPTARFILGKWLEKFGSTEAFPTGEEGFEAFQIAWDCGCPFNLISLDINLPGMNGQEVLKKIRQFEKEKSIPRENCAKVLMATSEENSISVMASFKEECNGYMTKPFSRKVLIDHLEKMELFTIPKPQPKMSLSSLIIEDDKNTRFILSKWLNERGDCECLENGKEGFEKFVSMRDTNKPYDLVLLDINMPEMNGLEVLKGIRDYEEGMGIDVGKGAKVIMVTSENNSKKVMEAFEKNCDGYLTKPLAKKKMTSLLEELNLIPSES
jgi:two-component system, chemotaxis family, chemotaxis protein CheY